MGWVVGDWGVGDWGGGGWGGRGRCLGRLDGD